VKEYKEDSNITIPQQILNHFVQEMESKIKLYPEQWYNYYNFWQ